MIPLSREATQQRETVWAEIAIAPADVFCPRYIVLAHPKDWRVIAVRIRPQSACDPVVHVPFHASELPLAEPSPPRPCLELRAPRMGAGDRIELDVERTGESSLFVGSVLG
jgi:hypothetical protein